MVPLTALLLPIFVAAVLVFIASSVIHVVLGYHKSDYKKHPREDELRSALRGVGLERGTYAIPRAETTKEMGSPEMLDKYKEGPVAMITVLPSGPPQMAKGLALWFGYSLVVGLFAAYIGGRTLGAGADYLAVFRVTGAVSFVAYGVGNLVDSVWKGQAWSATARHVADGLIYSLLTAGAFGWLWPI